MEHTPPNDSRETEERSSPWGLFIGLALILSIIVGAAFYSFTERYASVTQTASIGH